MSIASLIRPARSRVSARFTRDQRQGVLWTLHRTSGRIGVNELMNVVWPSATRVSITDIKARWRYAAHRCGGRLCGLVQWTRAGSVWAMDWTDPDHALEGGYEKILSVRDLASGAALLALPSAVESGELVARELRRLVERYGAPAVLKEDNGRSPRCQSVELVLGYYVILALTSPPACPGYNGACEAGIGALKVVIGEMAAACGRDRAWTSTMRVGASMNGRNPAGFPQTTCGGLAGQSANGSVSDCGTAIEHTRQQSERHAASSCTRRSRASSKPLSTGERSLGRWRKKVWSVSDDGGFVRPFEAARRRAKGEVHRFCVEYIADNFDQMY